MSRTRMKGSLARRECRAGFFEVSLQLRDPSKWSLAVLGGFFREENIIVLEERSIMEMPSVMWRVTIRQDAL